MWERSHCLTLYERFVGRLSICPFSFAGDRVRFVPARALVLWCVAGVVGYGSPVSARASHTVLVPGDYGTIQAALDNAHDGDTVLVSSGTYTEHIQLLEYSKNVYLKAVDGPSVTTISGSSSSRILTILNAFSTSAVRSVTFDGFTFANGLGDANTSAIMIEDSKPLFLNCVFSNNHSAGKGGAVLAYGSAGYPEFVHCTFRHNSSDQFAGAALINGDHVQALFKACLFESNSNRTSSADNDNSAGALQFTVAGGTVIDCTFRNNASTFTGGAIMMLTQFAHSADTVTVVGCTFEGNYASKKPIPATAGPTEGGAIHAEDNVNCIVRACYFTNNFAFSGGGINSYRANVTVSDSVFDNCRAVGTNFVGFGGAIGVNANDVMSSDTREPTLIVKNTLIRNCRAPAGSGLFVAGDPTYSNRTHAFLNDVVIEHCLSTTASNGFGHGGGAFFTGTDCTASNMVVYNCTAEGFGGAYVILLDASLTLIDGISAGNNAAADPYFHPWNAPITEVNNLAAYNNGSPTANAVRFRSIPGVTLGDRAYLTHFVAPYSGSPSIAPGIGVLSNRGGYAAGTTIASGLSTDRTYTLSSGHPDQNAFVTYARNGQTNVAFSGSPSAVPVIIEAEDFDRGGEGVAYRDLTANNEGGAYRPSEGVDLSVCNDVGGGYMVSHTKAGEYLEYLIDVPTAGSYDFHVRLASSSTGGMFYATFDGADKTGPIVVPDTGGSSAWQTLSVTGLSLNAGWQKMCIVLCANGEDGTLANLNYFQLGELSAGISLDKTVYLGHDGGASCPGGVSVQGDVGTAVTYCFAVANTGEVALSQVTVTDSAIDGFSPINLGTLASGEVVSTFFESSIVGSLTNTASVSGNPAVGSTVHDVDTAIVITADSDMDGLDDDWEWFHFGDLGVTDGTGDWDGDGVIDAHEFLAGTEPKDNTSYLHLLGPEPLNSITIRWMSASNKSYTVYRALEPSSSYQAIASNLVATPPVNSYSPSLEGRGVYRIGLE